MQTLLALTAGRITASFYSHVDVSIAVTAFASSSNLGRITPVIDGTFGTTRSRIPGVAVTDDVLSVVEGTEIAGIGMLEATGRTSGTGTRFAGKTDSKTGISVVAILATLAVVSGG